MPDILDDSVLTPEGLKRWRERLGLSQTEAAALLGVVQRTVSGWEMGQSRIPLTVVYAVNWLSGPRRWRLRGKRESER